MKKESRDLHELNVGILIMNVVLQFGLNSKVD